MTDLTVTMLGVGFASGAVVGGIAVATVMVIVHRAADAEMASYAEGAREAGYEAAARDAYAVADRIRSDADLLAWEVKRLRRQIVAEQALRVLATLRRPGPYLPTRRAA